MSNELGITPIAYALAENGIAAINAAFEVHDAAIWTALLWSQAVALSDEATTDLTTGLAKITIHYDGPDVILSSVFVGLSTQSSTGVVTVDVNLNGVSIFTTPPSIDALEDTSLTGTDAVLNGTVTFTRGDKITFDVDAAGTGARGLKCYLAGRRVV